jgi:hypothetical protein
MYASSLKVNSHAALTVARKRQPSPSLDLCNNAPQNTQSATGDCGTFTFMLKASLDDPQGRKTLDDFVDILSK